MGIYIVFIMLLTVIWAFYEQYNCRQVLKLYGGLLTLLIGLRSLDIGTDTASYCADYLSYSGRDLISLLKNNTELGDSNYLFYIFNKCISLIFPDNYTAYLLFVGLIAAGAFMVFLKQFSTNYYISTLLGFFLGYFFFFMTGIKQTLAMSVLMIAFISLKNKKWIWFVILVVIAALFHNTAIIALVALPIYRLGFRRIYVGIVPMLIFLAYRFRTVIVIFFQSYVTEGKYAIYGTDYVSENNLTGLFIQIAILLFTVILLWNEIDSDDNVKFFVSVYTIGIFFQTLTPVLAEFFRISMYFSIMGTVMIPYAISETTLFKDNKKIITFVSMTVLFAYFIISNQGNTSIIPYRFFWQK